MQETLALSVQHCTSFAEFGNEFAMSEGLRKPEGQSRFRGGFVPCIMTRIGDGLGGEPGLEWIGGIR